MTFGAKELSVKYMGQLSSTPVLLTPHQRQHQKTEEQKILSPNNALTHQSSSASETYLAALALLSHL